MSSNCEHCDTCHASIGMGKNSSTHCQIRGTVNAVLLTYLNIEIQFCVGAKSVNNLHVNSRQEVNANSYRQHHRTTHSVCPVTHQKWSTILDIRAHIKLE